MKTWGELTDEEYLAWNVAAKTRRTHGINYFKQVNLRRARRGEELARVPPQPKPYDNAPVLKRLILRNRGGGRQADGTAPQPIGRLKIPEWVPTASQVTRL
jgi:hypothetical protein